ncbi:hypothetical protein AHAS_Ahas06G0038800 [Arachis hypogaea]
MDTTFIDALIEECRKRDSVDGTFTTMAYDNILLLLKSIYGNHLHKENLKNRLKTLKDHFGMFEDEAEIWKELIRAKPKVKKWMRTPIKHYDKLFEIYGTDRATEKHAKKDEWNNELITPNATSFIMGHSPEIGLSN